jgi:hypothetical protein
MRTRGIRGAEPNLREVAMRAMRFVRRGVPAIGLAALAACGAPEPERKWDPPPPVVDNYHRDRPVFHVLDPNRPEHYFVYLRKPGLEVLTVEPGVGLRPATAEETRFTLARYEAFGRIPREYQAEAYAELARAERAAKRNIDAELLALMQRSIRQWEEQKRALELKQEAARAVGMKEEGATYDTLIRDLDRRILVHEIKLRLYASPEWKAARSTPNEVGIPLRPAEGQP